MLYLTASRPDIIFSVYLCAGFQSFPKDSYLTIVKFIYGYLEGTPNLGLYNPRTNNFELVGYSDTDIVGC